MRIIIAGAGAVGTHLAKLLSRENMDISLIDEDASRLGDLSADYDMLTRVACPTSMRDLRDIGVKDVDIFVAVTPHESVNITACMLANKLGAKKTLARIDNYEYLLPENRRMFEELGLNHLIYPEVLAAKEITDSLHVNWMRYHLSLCNGVLELCVVKMREGAPMIGKKFSSGAFNHGLFRVVAMKRGMETIIPTGNDEIMPDDMVYIVCTRDNIDYVRQQAGKDSHSVNNIMFIGGTRIAQKAVQALGSEKNIKIIEPDRERCYALSEKISNALIINADGRDMDTLKEEGILDVDAFIAVTENSEANIFACLAAQKLGVKRTIAEIENIDYIPLAEGLDIGAVINKKTITSSYIYQMMLDTSVLNVRNLTSADAQIVEFEAKKDSLITRKKIKDVGLPFNVNIGGLVRDGIGVLVNGDTQILPDDKVAVFCRASEIRKLDKFFR